MKAQLFWTRDATHWEEDKKHLSSALLRGVKVFSLPCVSTESIPVTSAPNHVSAIVMTSARAAAEALTQPALLALLKSGAVIHTFSEAVERTLAPLSVARTTTAKNGKELAAHLAATLAPGSRVAFVTAEEPAFAIDEELSSKGLEASRIVCYKTMPLALISKEADAALVDGGVICFASPSAVLGFVRARGGHLSPTKLIAAVIGETTGAAAKAHFAKLVIGEGLAGLVAAALAAFPQSVLPSRSLA